MAKAPDRAKASMIAEFLRRIDRGDDVRVLAKDASRIAEDISPAELAAAERSLLSDGYTPTAVNQLSDAFVLMRMYEQQVCGPKDRSQDGHILQKVTAEHGVFRCLAAELREATADLRAMECMECISDTASEYRRLIHVVDHLSAMKEHFEREDDVILPYMRRFGWANLCVVAENDHAQLRADIDSLTSLVTAIQAFSPEDFLTALVAGVGRFCSCLSEHLSFEDGLLWPIALVVIDNPAVWRTMKALCEEIGYCGIHVA
jgi:DUF438 domain-containing protein